MWQELFYLLDTNDTVFGLVMLAMVVLLLLAELKIERGS